MKRVLLLSLVMLCALGLSIGYAQDDPFAGLGGGEDSGLGTPDGASSIRAKKKASPQTFEGRVQAIVKNEKDFPNVKQLKVKITKAPSAKKAPHKELKKGQVYEFSVDWALNKDGKPCMKKQENVPHVGIFFMEKGDKVVGELKEVKDGKYILKFLERK